MILKRNRISKNRTRISHSHIDCQLYHNSELNKNDLNKDIRRILKDISFFSGYINAHIFFCFCKHRRKKRRKKVKLHLHHSREQLDTHTHIQNMNKRFLVFFVSLQVEEHILTNDRKKKRKAKYTQIQEAHLAVNSIHRHINLMRQIVNLAKKIIVIFRTF